MSHEPLPNIYRSFFLYIAALKYFIIYYILFMQLFFLIGIILVKVEVKTIEEKGIDRGNFADEAISDE